MSMPITRRCKQSKPLSGGTGSIGSSTPETWLFMVPFPTRRSNGSGRRKIPCPSWEIRTTGFFESWQGGHWASPGGEKTLPPDIPESRFRELARKSTCQVRIMGHSHTPFHKIVDGVHFLNPGSVGRMFDGGPRP